MSPQLPSMNLANISLIDAKVIGNGLLRFPLSKSIAYSLNVLFCQFCPPIPLTFGIHAFTLRDKIYHIIQSRSNKQMTGIKTRGIIAMMQNAQGGPNGKPFEKISTYSMRHDHPFSFQPHHAISRPISASHPQPASRFRINIPRSQEPFAYSVLAFHSEAAYPLSQKCASGFRLRSYLCQCER